MTSARPDAPSSPARSAEALHQRGVAANESGQPGVAEKYLRRALERAVVDPLRARILITLAHARAEQGNGLEGLALLTDAEPLAGRDDALRGLIAGQRGLLLVRLGRHPAAQEDLVYAVQLLRGEPLEQARSLLNLSVAQCGLGDLKAARSSLDRCVAVAEGTPGGVAVQAKARHNLAYLDMLRGDLPAALRGFEEAYLRIPAGDNAVRAASRVDLASALLLGGLTTEADATLADAIAVLHSARLREDEAQSWLARAEVALEDGRREDAAQNARIAHRLFRRRGSHAGLLLAQAIELLGAAHRRPTERLRDRVSALSADLAAAGLVEESRRLPLLVARDLARTGRTQLAVAVAGPAIDPRRGDSLRTRVLTRTVRAQLALGRGDRRAHASEIRSGLADLQRHQSRLGSLDLQTAIVRFGSELAEMGLRDAVASGRPTTTLHWLERTRALATRLPPVLPPEDAQMADLLQSLRYQRLELTQAARDPSASEVHVSHLRRTCRDLERAAAARERQTAGGGTVVAPATAASVASALANASSPDGSLVNVFDVDGLLHALVLTSQRAHLTTLGPVKPVADAVRRARADLDVLALSSTPAHMRSIVLASLRRSLAGLNAAVWAPLADLVDDGPLAIVPTGVLATMPWTLLPGLRGRPLTVARAPGEWIRGREWPSPQAGPNSRQARAVFVTGPRVARAEEEVRAAARVWSNAEVMTLPQPGNFLDAASGADLVHVAAHGNHDVDNPLFSSLELSGGLVFGHDLTRVRPAPWHVVLSACDLGLATVRPGGESLGMTAALLHAGTSSVIAGVARVADDIACDVAVAYHQRLSAGERPSYALSGALSETGADGSGDWPAPLTCFGSGW